MVAVIASKQADLSLGNAFESEKIEMIDKNIAAMKLKLQELSSLSSFNLTIVMRTKSTAVFDGFIGLDEKSNDFKVKATPVVEDFMAIYTLSTNLCMKLQSLLDKTSSVQNQAVVSAQQKLISQAKLPVSTPKRDDLDESKKLKQEFKSLKKERGFSCIRLRFSKKNVYLFPE